MKEVRAKQAVCKKISSFAKEGSFSSSDLQVDYKSCSVIPLPRIPSSSSFKLQLFVFFSGSLSSYLRIPSSLLLFLFPFFFLLLLRHDQSDSCPLHDEYYFCYDATVQLG